MTTRSNSSRERILKTAESIILQKGFNATSIEDIFEQSAVTKGGFFYHFESKAILAKALVERYLRQDNVIFEELTKEATELSEDPLHQLLIFLKLLADMMRNMETTHPGCLVASFTYETQLFSENLHRLILSGIISWRKMMTDKIELANEKYTLQGDTSVETLADMFTVTMEGGILLARNFHDNQLLVDQIMAYRSFIRSLYGAN